MSRSIKRSEYLFRRLQCLAAPFLRSRSDQKDEDCNRICGWRGRVLGIKHPDDTEVPHLWVGVIQQRNNRVDGACCVRDPRKLTDGRGRQSPDLNRRLQKHAGKLRQCRAVSGIAEFDGARRELFFFGTVHWLERVAALRSFSLIYWDYMTTPDESASVLSHKCSIFQPVSGEYAVGLMTTQKSKSS